MKEIRLTKGLVALVDDWRFDELNQFNWYASGLSGHEYAARRLMDIEPRPKYLIAARPLIYMHHTVLNLWPWQLPNGMIPDHEDRNHLNNQEYNVVLKTYSANQYNSARSENKKGICYDATYGKWKSYYDIPLMTGKKRVNVGTFKTRQEAIDARANALAERE